MITLLFASLAICMAYFFITWAIGTRMNNYGLLDVAFSYGVAILAPLYAYYGDGLPLRKGIGLALGVAWSLRLGTHIFQRVMKHHPAEDVRYQTLRARWPGAGMLLVFFELQAALVVVFALPFLFISFSPDTKLGTLELIGWGLAAISLIGESVADAQLEKFKKAPANRGQVCDVGLWHYSRHPNYFFEALIQVGFCLMAWHTPYGWLTLASPVLMLYFLLRVTGIPLTEEHSLRSKGDAYRAYQRRTSAFIPWPPKKTL